MFVDSIMVVHIVTQKCTSKVHATGMHCCLAVDRLTTIATKHLVYGAYSPVVSIPVICPTTMCLSFAS